nr:hypothetical protein [Tanacetum cinerariifolium]
MMIQVMTMSSSCNLDDDADVKFTDEEIDEMLEGLRQLAERHEVQFSSNSNTVVADNGKQAKSIVQIRGCILDLNAVADNGKEKAKKGRPSSSITVATFPIMDLVSSTSTSTCLDKCAKLVDAILLRASAFLFLLR